MQKPKITPFNFKPDHKGIRKVLGALESSIMECLWKRDNATVRDIYECLSKDRQIAYTTVMTVMGRLSDKGLLEKTKEGNAYVYSAKVSSEDFNESITSSIMSGLADHLTASSLAHFVDAISADEQMLDELEKLIAEKRSNSEQI